MDAGVGPASVDVLATTGSVHRQYAPTAWGQTMTQDKVAIITAGGSRMRAGAARKTEAISAAIALQSSDDRGSITGQNLRVVGGIARSVCAMCAHV